MKFDPPPPEVNGTLVDLHPSVLADTVPVLAPWVPVVYACFTGPDFGGYMQYGASWLVSKVCWDTSKGEIQIRDAIKYGEMLGIN